MERDFKKEWNDEMDRHKCLSGVGIEKRYTFKTLHSMNNVEHITVVESDLSQAQKDLLLGEAIYIFGNLPDELKIKFCGIVNNSF
jgi:hypothetical protein